MTEKYLYYKTKMNHRCPDCGKLLSKKKYKYCLPCSKLGIRNPQWAGNKVCITALHDWIRRHKPKPSVCEICKKIGPYEVSNISGKYLRDINDFQWLCRGCHNRFDGKILYNSFTGKKHSQKTIMKMRELSLIRKRGINGQFA